jgi:hypothetical protein
MSISVVGGDLKESQSCSWEAKQRLADPPPSFPVAGRMSDRPSLPPRFMVRKGTRDYMVYDREMRGPAKLANGQPAIGLSREDADQLCGRLVMFPPPRIESK